MVQEYKNILNDNQGPPRRLDKADIQQLAEVYAKKRYTDCCSKKNRKKFRDLAVQIFRSDEFKYEID